MKIESWLRELASFIPYLIGVNAITFLFMGLDKQKAKQQKYRIPERTFWLLALIGGSIGAWLGMQSFRHKTKHRSFVIGIPALFLAQVVIIISYSFL